MDKLPVVGNPSSPDEPVEDLGMTDQELEDGIARLKKERAPSTKTIQEMDGRVAQ